MNIKIIINEDCFIVDSKEDLKKYLIGFNNNEFNEIWISGHQESSLCVLMNKTHSFLMFLCSDSDSGFSSRNTQDDNEETMDFKLSNGQLDAYPINWLVDNNFGKLAILEYYKTGRMCDKIKWERD